MDMSSAWKSMLKAKQHNEAASSTAGLPDRPDPFESNFLANNLNPFAISMIKANVPSRRLIRWNCPLLLYPKAIPSHYLIIYPPIPLIINPPDPTIPAPLIETRYDTYQTGLKAPSVTYTPVQAEAARLAFVESCCKKAQNGNIYHFYFETEGTCNRFKKLYASITGIDQLRLHLGVIHESAYNPHEEITIITESDFYAYHTHRSAHAVMLADSKTRTRE